MISKKIHEDILRHVWSGQYLDAERLGTADGRRLRVIEPGMLNRGSGPDFRDAVIAIDGVTLRGDVEFHRSMDDWKAHSHDVNVNYNSVILHVVFRGDTDAASTISASGRAIPVLILEGFLSSPLERIVEHAIRDEQVSRSGSLRCLRYNDGIDAQTLELWIRQLFLDRMKEKAARMLSRLYQIVDEQDRGVFEPSEEYLEDPDDIPISELSIDRGELRRTEAWEQLLYGALMDGLGYARNRLPFRTLAYRISIQRLRFLSAAHKLGPAEMQAIFFHVSGLLPDIRTMKDQQSKVYVHLIHTIRKELYADPHVWSFLSMEQLHAADWVFTPTRPSNFPTVRLAAAGHLASKIVYENLFERIITTLSEEQVSAHNVLEQLLAVFDIPEDPFWNYHYSFSDTPGRRHSLLGDARKHDIIMNALLPIVSLYGSVFEKEFIREKVAAVAATIPPLESNAVIRKMEKQLLKKKLPLRYAFQQQGAIHLHRRYCSPGRCSDCAVGKIVWGEGTDI